MSSVNNWNNNFLQCTWCNCKLCVCESVRLQWVLCEAKQSKKLRKLYCCSRRCGICSYIFLCWSKTHRGSLLLPSYNYSFGFKSWRNQMVIFKKQVYIGFNKKWVPKCFSICGENSSFGGPDYMCSKLSLCTQHIPCKGKKNTIYLMVKVPQRFH